jgi:hypothetical protein
MAYTSSIGPYNSEKELWENYEVRLAAWLAVNGIENAAKKSAALIAEIGPEAFAILKDLSFPAAVTTKTYDELLGLLRAHFKNTRTPMAGRLNLHNRKQFPSESISDYIAALKKLAAKCEYGAELENRLRDTFTFGIRNPKIVKRLLEESQRDNFTWARATTIALAMEVVDQDVQGLHTQSQDLAGAAGSDARGDVHRVRSQSHSFRRGRGRSSRGGYRNQGSGNSNFSARGGYNNRSQPSHQSGQSQSQRTAQSDFSNASANRSSDFSNVTCFQCGQRGHMKRNCPRRRRNFRPGYRGASGNSNSNRQRVRYVNEPDQVDENYYCDNSDETYVDNYHDYHNYHDSSDTCETCDDLAGSFHKLFSVSESAETPTRVRVPPEYEEVLFVNGVPVTFVIDTACPVALIPLEMYKKCFKNIPLRPAQLRLSSYSKHSVPVNGYIEVDVRYHNVTHRLPLYVTEGDDACLLGRQWLEKIRINWHKVFKVKESPDIKCLLNEFQGVFDDKQGSIRNFKADIRVKDGAKPLFHKARPVPYSLRDQVSKELDKLESKGVISKIESSDWAAPLVVVRKSDKSLRLCGDYKVTVNQVVQSDTYPLPNAEDLFASLSGGEVFTKLDLSAAYQQLELTEESKQYLVVNTLKGLYKYHRLSYGVSTAPSIFQRTMDQILQGIEGVQCYLDDILIASKKADHLAKVRLVLERLQKYGVQLKLKKCSFMKDRVTYLGHEITAKGIQPTQEKIEAIQNMRAPTDLHELRVLLGMVNYYAKYIPNQATLLAPWYNLLRKETPFHWSKSCQEAWCKMKKLLTSDKLLVHYDPRKEIILACDASPVGLGCVLSHSVNGVEKPIAFASRSLSPAEQNYCQLEREGLAIVYGLTKFHKYIYGRHFTIVTDNKPISRILGSKVGVPSLAASRLQRWSLILMAHDYELRFKSSKDHANCDGLSRLPAGTDNYLAQELPVNYFSFVDELPIEAKHIASASRNDPVLARVLNFVMSGWPAHCPSDDLKPFFNRRHELTADQGCILWGNRVVIPPCHREKLLEDLHMTHPGIVRMKSLARSYLWFPGIDSAIESLVNACSVCQAMQKNLQAYHLLPGIFLENVGKGSISISQS